jgi:hypothetical protein
MSSQDPTAAEALALARDDINRARDARSRADAHRQTHYARSTIDLSATILLDPTATAREIVAAHSFLIEALALDGRPNTCGAELVNTEEEAAALCDEDRQWLNDFLANRPRTARATQPTPASAFNKGTNLHTAVRAMLGDASRTNPQTGSISKSGSSSAQQSREVGP